MAMAAVIPARDTGGLEKPKAFIVPRESAREQLAESNGQESLRKALQQHVKENLSMHKYPRWVVFVDDLPKNDRGKSSRKELIAREERGENPWS